MFELILNVTERCDRACGYCRVPKSGRSMSWDTACRALGEAEGQPLPSVGFYGGEPLIEAELVIRAMGRAMSTLNRPVFTLTTNGRHLDEGLLDRMEGAPIDISLSHDGMRQGSTRPSPGIDALADADRAARALLEYKPASLAMCTYRPQDVPGLRRDVEHLAGLGFKRISLNPDLYSSGWDFDELESELIGIMDDFPGAAVPSGSEPCVCTSRAGRTLFVDTDGTYYPCLAHKGRRDLAIGDAEHGVDRCARDSVLARSAMIPERCVGCEHYSRCMVGCGCARLISTGGLEGVSDDLCAYERMLFGLRTDGCRGEGIFHGCAISDDAVQSMHKDGEGSLLHGNGFRARNAFLSARQGLYRFRPSPEGEVRGFKEPVRLKAEPILGPGLVWRAWGPGPPHHLIEAR